MKQFKIEKKITLREDKSVEKYLNDVSRTELITEEQEIELSKRIQQGDKVALDKLVTANLRFAISVAKGYQNNGIELPDLINEANIGLIKAVERFDHTRGFKFISFAVWWIRQSILQAIAEKKRIVYIPSNKNLEVQKYNKAISNLVQRLERYPTDEEIAEFMDIRVKDVKELDAISAKTGSINAKVGNSDDSSTLEDLLKNNEFADPDDSLIHESLKDDIDRALSNLTDKEVRVLKSFYGIGCKQKSKEVIAMEMNYTPERIRQIKKKAEEKIAKDERAQKLLLKYI